MTAGRTATVTLPTDTSIVVARGFAGSPHRVYRACTEPDLVRQWFGGGPGAVEIAHIDLRIGGRWRFVVVGEGYTVGFHGVYRELVPGARIVCTEVYESAPAADAYTALCTYTFTGANGHCSLALRTDVPTREHREALLDSGMEEGVASSWELLEQVAVALR